MAPGKTADPLMPEVGSGDPVGLGFQGSKSTGSFLFFKHEEDPPLEESLPPPTFTFEPKNFGSRVMVGRSNLNPLAYIVCASPLKTSTLSASAVFGVNAPSSQSLTRLSTEQKLGLGDFDLALLPVGRPPPPVRAEAAS